jgi:hypothetical protein
LSGKLVVGQLRHVSTARRPLWQAVNCHATAFRYRSGAFVMKPRMQLKPASSSDAEMLCFGLVIKGVIVVQWSL